MEGLVWLLVVAALFFLTMRFGCGAHVMHGYGHGGGHEGNEAGAKDPVCGTPRDRHRGYTKAQAGRSYWFCSRECLDKFEANPGRYASSVAPGVEHEKWH